MPKQLAKWIADVGGLEVASCHLVKHRRKESKVIPADEGGPQQWGPATRFVQDLTCNSGCNPKSMLQLRL
jgi:hypothetical protein